MLDIADTGCAVREWAKPLWQLPLCVSVSDSGTEADLARLFALVFVRHRRAWQQRLARITAEGIQPLAGNLALALGLSDAIVRRELLIKDNAPDPLPAMFTVPLPGLAGQYQWDMRNACAALAFALWDDRDRIEYGLEFATIDPAERAELAEAIMLAEVAIMAGGSIPPGTEQPSDGKATAAQRVAWHAFTTVVGLGAAA